MSCQDDDHNFQFQHTVYRSGSRLPGSGACERIYEDRYFCTKCLLIKHLNRRVVGNNYYKPIEGTMPK